MTKKFEKITLMTMIEVFGDKHDSALSALDEIVPLIEEYTSGGGDVTLIDWDLDGEYELVKKHAIDEANGKEQE